MNNLFDLLTIYNPSFSLDIANKRFNKIDNVLKQDEFVSFIQEELLKANIKCGGIETTIPPTYISIKVLVGDQEQVFKDNIYDNDNNTNCISWLQKWL